MRSKDENKQKYEYKLAGHIHAESLATVLNCDLMGSNQPRQEQLK
jgi:hypothetical protein